MTERRTAPKKYKPRRRRVTETALPSSDFQAPASWSVWESRARTQLVRAAARAAQ